MTIDAGESKYNAISFEVDFEEYSPERITEMWLEVFGEAKRNNVRREKFKNVNGTLTIENEVILRDAELKINDGSAILYWVNEDNNTMFLNVGRTSSIGIQTHKSGEKSVVVVRSSVDKATGAKNQTTRRFTPEK